MGDGERKAFEDTMNIGIVSVIHYAQEMALREKEERQKRRRCHPNEGVTPKG